MGCAGEGEGEGGWGQTASQCMIRGAERMMRGITTDTETEKCDMSVCAGMSVSQRAIVAAAAATKRQEEKRQGQGVFLPPPEIHLVG